MDDRQTKSLDEKSVKLRLDLKADGTFRLRLEDRVIYTVFLDAQGIYRVQGSTLILTGRQHAKTDDGYRKGARDGHFEGKFRIDRTGLYPLDLGKGLGLVYRRLSDGPPL